jgi:hypothetical protein
MLLNYILILDGLVLLISVQNAGIMKCSKQILSSYNFIREVGHSSYNPILLLSYFESLCMIKCKVIPVQAVEALRVARG